MKRYNRLLCLLLTIIVATSVLSCSKVLDIQPEDKLDVSQAYRNVADADAAVIGVYGKFLSLGKQYVLLNELRADLVDVTQNADPYLKQLSTHTNISTDNPYIDPRPFYEVILNCNDVLKNFNLMVKDSRMSVDDYNKRYSDIGALRSWLYLQLGIHYGEIPYVTEPIENIDDLQDLNRYPKIGFDELLTKLTDFTSNLPYIDSYAYPTGTSLVVTIDGNNTQKVFINKDILLGELYLWKGDYNTSAKYYKNALETESGAADDRPKFNYYKVIWYDSTYPLTVYYPRYQEESSLDNSLTSGWRSIFALPNTNNVWNSEWYWSLPYSASFNPGNPFIELFSNTSGKYLLKPSQVAIDNWNTKTQSNGIPYDARGIMSYSPGINPAITKFTDNSAATLTMLNKAGRWNIWRAAGVHLRYSEAANRDGHSKIGWALLNTGIRATFSPDATRAPTFEQVQLMLTPYSYPYDFDARYSGDVSSEYRRPWHRNTGIRGRANMPALSTSLQNDMVGLEDALIEEASLELAFEGGRWPDLLRIARRRNDPAFLANKIYQKLAKTGDPNAETVRAKLMDPKNWYLPFKIK